MKVLLCDKCKKVLISGNEVIVASAIRHKISTDAEIYKGGVTTSVLTGTHFCSIKCLKERIQ